MAAKGCTSDAVGVDGVVGVAATVGVAAASGCRCPRGVAAVSGSTRRCSVSKVRSRSAATLTAIVAGSLPVISGIPIGVLIRSMVAAS